MAPPPPRPPRRRAALGRSQPLEWRDVEVRRVQPFQARKLYSCPGCQQQILAGQGHVVVIPREAPDLRRHWHRPCWEARDRRRPGR